MRIAVEKLIGRRAGARELSVAGAQIELRFVFFSRSGAFRDNASLLYGNNSLSVSLNTKATAAVIR